MTDWYKITSSFLYRSEDFLVHGGPVHTNCSGHLIEVHLIDKNTSKTNFICTMSADC